MSIAPELADEIERIEACGTWWMERAIKAEAENRALREAGQAVLDDASDRDPMLANVMVRITKLDALHAALQPPKETRITVPSEVTRVRNVVTGETISTKEGSSDENT